MFEINVAKSFQYKDNDGNIKPESFGELIYEDFLTKETMEDPEGWRGVTLAPGDRAKTFNSIDNIVRISLNINLKEVDMAKTLSHEAFGHAYLYSKGVDWEHKPGEYDAETGTTKDWNTDLKYLIEKGEAETLKNIVE